jgi:hypothetical protein
MLSVVVPSKADLPAHLKTADVLSVRARRKGDIEAVFSTARVIRLRDRDYAFRAYIDRWEVADVMRQAVLDIGYHNFKDSVRDDARHDAYMDVWTAMFKFQGGVYDEKVAARRKRVAQHTREVFDPVLDDDMFAADSRWNFAERGR